MNSLSAQLNIPHTVSSGSSAGSITGSLGGNFCVPLRDEDISGSAWARSWALTATTSIELGSAIAGSMGETVTYEGLRAIVILVRKTETTTSGSVVLSCAALGWATRTISPGTATNAKVGEVVDIMIFASQKGVSSAVSGAEIVATFTSRVGFQVEVYVDGELND